MKTIGIPQTTMLQAGKLFKVLRVSGNKGNAMPEHYCTHEAVITVQKGAVILKISGTEYPIRQNQSFIIPTGEPHSLKIEEDFEANVIMKIDAEIKFVNV